MKMLKKFTNCGVVGCLLLLAAVAATPSPQEQAATEKRPKDQVEYELINKAFKETNPATKIQLLDEWKEKYPESDYAEDRVRLYMRTHQQAGNREKAIEVAKEILSETPDDFEANFTITTLTPLLGSTDAAVLDTGVKSAQALLKGKPASLNDQQWEQVKTQVLTASHQTIGWVQMQRKENVKAEAEFKEVLKLAPGSAQISYWLGNVVLSQGDPNKNELAMFSFARAGVVEGEGALNAEGRAQVNDYLSKVYTKYTGTEDGLAELKAMAKNNPLPPADLKIKSKQVREFEAEQKRRAENPDLYKFIDLRDLLSGSGGDAIWADMNGKMVGPLALYVVGADSDRPQRLDLSSKVGGAPEVVLNLENRLRARPGNGQQIKIEGVASELTKSPFKLLLRDGKTL